MINFKKLTYCVILLLSVLISQQNEPCGSSMPDYNFWLDYMTEEELNSLERSDRRFIIPLVIYIVYNSQMNDYGLTADEVSEALEHTQTNLDNNDVGITLSYNEIDFIEIDNADADYDDFYLYPLQPPGIADLNDLIINQDKLNIFFTLYGAGMSAYSVCGLTLGYFANFIIINNDCALNTSTITHEIGHILGLFHTHENFNENVTRDENHDCFNCNVAGDYLCDTNADPGLYSEEYSEEFEEDDMNVNSECVYYGEESNMCFPYSFTYEDVDTRNIMSYSYSTCRDNFSENQVAIMQFFANIYDPANEIIEVEIKNIRHGYPVSNLGGLLRVFNEEFEYVVESGADIPLVIGNEINVFTMGIDASEGELFHLKWNGNLTHYKRNLLDFDINYILEGMGIKADYEEKISFTFQSDTQITNTYKMIRDPWFYDEENDEQPNILKPLSDFGMENSYPVFALINLFFDDQYPIYSVKVPKYIASNNEIYIFDEWSGDGVSFEGGNNSNELEAEVVFLQNNANLIANYSLLNISPNYTLHIHSDELFVITENSYLDLPEGFKIIVDGGTIISEERSTLTSTSGWQGIEVRENSSINMASTTIKNAESLELWNQTDATTFSNCTFNNNGYVIAIEGRPQFNNCTFRDNQVGLISLSLTNPVTTPLIENCTFENNDLAGMLSGYRSMPVLNGNSFINNGDGLRVSFGSEPYLFTNGVDCSGTNNLFDENVTGVRVYNSGLPWLGISVEGINVFEGYNRFAANTWDVYSENINYPIYAQMNHWQFDPTNPCESGEATVFGDIYWHPTISENSGGTIAQQAFYNEVLENYILAASQYIALIMEDPDDSLVKWAIAGLVRCYSKLDQNADLITLLEQIAQDYPSTTSYLYASTYIITQLIDEGNYEEALNQILLLEGLYPQSELSPKHLFEEWIIAEKTGGLSRNGLTKKQIAEKLIEEYPQDDFGITMSFIQGTGIPENTEGTAASANLPSGYSLSTIYPNPFNPFTTIAYEILEETNVTLSVYDLKDRKLENLVTGSVQAGKYEVTWNADHYSSGIYFIKMLARQVSSGGTAPNYKSSRKVILMK